MNNFDTLKQAFDEIGVDYLVGSNGEWRYIFPCSEKTKKDYEGYSESDILESLTRTSDPYFEFENGNLASY